MERLYILYDARCGICRRAREWAQAQPAYIPLTFLPAGSEEARRRFPGLSESAEPEELIAIGDRGEVYRNDSAWIMCLFALEDYREWANRLASPALRPLARQSFAFISRQRGNISRWLGMTDDQTVARGIQESPAPVCELDPEIILQRVETLNSQKRSMAVEAEQRRSFRL